MAIFSEKSLQSELDAAVVFFVDRIGQLRAGRPRPEMFASIDVEAYGTTSPLNALANVIVESALMVVIQPWDKSIVNDIVKAIRSADLGYSPVIDGDKVRINIPAMTEERRQQIIKELHAMLEEAKVRVRQVRQKYNKQVEGADGVSEEEQKRDKASIQKMVDAVNDKLEELAIKKEEELKTI